MTNRGRSIEDSKAAGLSMAEVLTLPPPQRKIVQWLMKQSQQGATLAELADRIAVDEQTTLALLDELVEEGFVQETAIAGDISYRILLAAKRGIEQENLQQALAPGSPLSVILNPSADSSVAVGEAVEICVTVTNKGAESALIDIFIEELTPNLLQWWDAPRQRLALSSNTSGEVLFSLQVPVTATTGANQYQIVVDAPQHYPEDTPMRYRRKIQVLPAVETVVQASDPTLTLLPPTSSRSPAKIPPNGIVQVNVSVHNRSERVDQFRLTCPDLDSSWYTVRYPEGLETVGLVAPNMSLDLNPGSRGDILLIFQPPPSAVAGLYYPTIRLYSANNPDLVLLDVVYLEILPFYLVNVELLTIFGRVKRQGGVYEVRLTNAGNTKREILCRVVAADEENACTYTVTPTLLQVLPGAKVSSQVTVKPVKWWQRPLFGAARLINFRIELEDQKELPIPNASSPGTLIWEPRPFWQFLLVLLTVLGTLGTLIFIIWWLYFRPPATPKIVQFSASDNLYQAANGDWIRLNWQIRHPKQLQSLLITGVLSDGTAAVQPIIYKFNHKFNGSLPEELKPFCQMAAVLTCTNVPTEARKAGDYVFEIKAFNKNNQEAAADTIKTSTIKILPEPPPQIVEFYSAKPGYQEVAEKPQTKVNVDNIAAKQPEISSDTIRLNWKINHSERIKELLVIGRTPEGLINSPIQRYDFTKGIPTELQTFCAIPQSQLICRNVPANNRGAGNYIFEILLLSTASPDKPIDVKKTDVIKVQALPSKILEFQIDGKNAPAKYLIPINPTKPKVAVTLSWKVGLSKNLKVALLPAPGNVLPTGTIVYPISQEPSSETITLQVTNAAGEIISRSVTIQTFIPLTKPSTPNAQPPLPKLEPAPPPGGALPAIPPSIPPSTPPVIPPPASPPPAPPAPVVPPPASPPGSTNNQSAPTPATPSPTPTPAPPPAPTPGSPTPSQPETLSPSELPPEF